MTSLGLPVGANAEPPDQERLSVTWAGIDLIRDEWGRTLIESVSKASEADGAGLKTGDRLLRVFCPEKPQEPRMAWGIPQPALPEEQVGLVDDNPLSDVAELFSGIESGHEVQVTYERNKKSKTVSLRFNAPPIEDQLDPSMSEELREYLIAQAKNRVVRSHVDGKHIRGDKLGLSPNPPLKQISVDGPDTETPGRIRGLSSTGAWLVHPGGVNWSCSDVGGSMLEILTGPANHRVQWVRDLKAQSNIHGATQTANLYLFPIQKVAQVCSQKTDLQLQTAPIDLTLTCADGKVSRRHEQLTLNIHCNHGAELKAEAATKGEREAKTHVFQGDWLDILRAPSVDARVLNQGEPQTLHLLGRRCPQGSEARPSQIRVVSLNEHDQVLESFTTFCELGPGGEDLHEQNQVQFTYQPSTHDPLRLALEYDYPDGSKRLSAITTLPVLNEAEQRKEEARWFPRGAFEAFLETASQKKKELGCTQEFVDWLKSQKYVSEAVMGRHGIGILLTDERTASIDCQPLRK
jgi:hypothetical protein